MIALIIHTFSQKQLFIIQVMFSLICIHIQKLMIIIITVACINNMYVLPIYAYVALEQNGGVQLRRQFWVASIIV